MNCPLAVLFTICLYIAEFLTECRRFGYISAYSTSEKYGSCLLEREEADIVVGFPKNMIC